MVYTSTIMFHLAKKDYIISSSVVILVLLGITIFSSLGTKTLQLPQSEKTTMTILKSNSSKNVQKFDHIVLIIMENKSSQDIFDNTNAPYINSLIKNDSYADNYHAVSHPSLPNYISLIGGSTFGITSDCTNCFVNAQNLVDQFDKANIPWKAYMESMPSPCFLGSSGEYAQKHDPFIYFNDIRTNQSRCNKIVPYTQLALDLKKESTTPNFIWITPNLCNDMHDCSIQTGDTWLSKQVPMILNSPAFTKSKSLLVITWDENDGSGVNRVPAIFIGNSVKAHFVSNSAYTHYSLLHTVEVNWNLSPLTKNAAQSSAIVDLFNGN